MLESLRNLGKSWIAKGLMLFLAASFVVWGIQDVFSGFSSSSLATVGEQKISSQDYQNLMRQTMQNIARTTGQAMSAEEARKQGYDKAVLDNLIQQAAVDEEIRDMKLVVSPQAVIAAATADPAFRDASGKFSEAVLNNVLRNNGMSVDQFISSQESNMARGAIVGSIGVNYTVPKTMMDAFAAFKTEQRDATYFKIKASASDVQAPTDAEIKAQYEQTPAAYTAPEYRSVAVLKAYPDELAPTLKVTPEEVQAAFDKYRSQYSVPERRAILQIPFPSVEEAQKAKDQLAAGKDFVALATERGLKPADYTLTDKTQSDLLDKEIAKAAFSLKQDEISPVVKGALVTALLKVTSITPGFAPSLDQIKDKITAQAQLDKAKEQVQVILDNVENARNNQSKLEDIAKDQNLKFTLIPAVSAQGLDKDGKEVDLPDKADLLRAVFASDVGDITSVLTPADGFVWYDVREVIPSALRPLDTVKAKVASDVTARKIREFLATKAGKIVADIKGGKSLTDAAAQDKAEVKTAKALRRNDTSEDFDMVALSALFALPVNGTGWSLEGDGTTAKIIQSAPGGTGTPPSEAETSKLKENLSQAISVSLANGYLQNLRQEIPVSIDASMWKLLSGGAQ